MRVFVTGASGFVGAHVTRALLRRGHCVTALISPNSPAWRLRGISGLCKAVSGRLDDRELLKLALDESKPDACVHLAWYAEPGKYLHSTRNIACLSDTLSLLEALLAVGCRQVVMAGTCAEYDTDFGYLRENTPTRPTTLYAAAKLSCCILTQQIASAENIHLAWGRIFYPYGPQEDERRVIPALIRALHQGQSFAATKGDQARDYIYVEDVAEAFCTLLEKEAHGVFNISSGVAVTVRQVLETIGDLMGRSGLISFGSQPYRNWEPPFICGDNHNLRDLGWSPNHSLGKGLAQTIEWWKAHPAGCRDDIKSVSSV